MIKKLMKRRIVAQLVQLYAHPEIRTNKRFDVKVRLAHFDDMIVYCEQRLAPRKRAGALWRMLNSLDEADVIDPYQLQMSTIAALLELGHLTDDERARLHLRWARAIILFNMMHCTMEEVDHVDTARRLVSEERLAQLLKEYRMEGFLSRLS